jgi:RNA polymerase sigma-70 factor (ECF subfamily)
MPQGPPAERDKVSLAGDGILVERATDGDVAAFEVLARRHAPLMRAYARRLTGSSADADDVVQEALLQAWTQIGDLRDGDAAKSWLMRITSSRGIDHLRRRKDHDPIPDGHETPDRRHSPESAAVAGSGMTALRKALGILPEDQRRCWTLREMGGLSYEEIARELDISTPSVRGKLARARTTLMKDMENWR